jgi:hypothetical protein
MPLLNINSNSISSLPFNKEEVVADIRSMLSTEFPHFHTITYQPNCYNDLSTAYPYDILLLRSISINRVHRIKSANPFEKEIEDTLQLVYAVSVIDPLTSVTPETFTEGWTKKHFVVSDAQTLKGRLKNEAY